MWFVSERKYLDAKAQLTAAINDRERAEFELQFMKTKHKEELTDYKDMIEQNNGLKLRVLSKDAELASCQSRLTLSLELVEGLRSRIVDLQRELQQATKAQKEP